MLSHLCEIVAFAYKYLQYCCLSEVVKAVADSLMEGNESEPSSAPDDLGDYCWLNDSCPPSAEDAATAAEPAQGMLTFYTVVYGTVW